MSGSRDSLWFHRAPWSVLEVTGPDAASFLHNLCTNEIKALPTGGACEALFADVKGRVLAHAVICRAANAFDVVVTSDAAEELRVHLDRYHIRESLEMQIVDWQAAVVSDLCESADDFSDGEQSQLAGWWPLPGLGEAAGIGLVAANAPFRGLKGIGWRELSDEEFAEARIEHRFPLDRIDVTDKNLPQEVNRNQSLISFTKGCYLGQETVARIDALGRVNRLLVKLRIEGQHDVAAGEPIVSQGKQVGEVTSAAWSPRVNATLMLGYVRREQSDPETVLTIRAGSAKVSAV